MKITLSLILSILSFNSFALSVVQKYVPECNSAGGVSAASTKKVIAAKGYQGRGTGKDFCVSKKELESCQKPTKEACNYNRKEIMRCKGVASVYKIDCDGKNFKDCCISPIEKNRRVNKNRSRKRRLKKR